MWQGINGEIWKKPAEGDRWSILKRRSGAGLGQREYLYHILASKNGTLCVTAAAEILLLDRNGADLQRVKPPHQSSTTLRRELFFRAQFAADEEAKIIVEANPYTVYVLDLRKGALTRWNDGVETLPPDGMAGPARIVPHGDGFLMSTYDGVYVADGVLEPWRRISKPTEPDDYVAQKYCRAFCSMDAPTNQWLMADGAGIHVMQEGEKMRTVFVDKPDQHDLVLDITPFGGNYFISFARLKGDTLGVRLAGDLSHWESLSLAEKPIDP
ncbi:MAG TPA: hypothetical protein VFW87_23365 [Pirellulales bacterium]|nr:hypothetical protein [Pirellulales bacterium]